VLLSHLLISKNLCKQNDLSNKVVFTEPVYTFISTGLIPRNISCIFTLIFQEYLKDPGDPRCLEDIKKDLHRQFPLHEMFMSRGGYG